MDLILLLFTARLISNIAIQFHLQRGWMEDCKCNIDTPIKRFFLEVALIHF